MVLVLKSGSGKEDIRKLEKQLEAIRKKSGGIEAKKYSGVLKLKNDPLELQKEFRGEWD